MNKIEVQGVHKSYRERRKCKRSPEDCMYNQICPVLQDINFSVKAGGFTCLIGPSGCGKSTMLQIIAGFDTAYRGSVLVDQEEVIGPRPRHIFVFQEDGLFPWMTAFENVALGARYIQDPENRQNEVMDHLDLVGLKDFEDHYPHELSGGMRRRAEVARALITNPEILYMDEPFGALDFVTRLQMREEMLNVHSMFDSTILFITHDIDEAIQLGDQIIVMAERPSTVKADISLPFPHPRDISTGELSELRKEVYFLMGLHAAL